jgi:predicted nucleotidyltransferase
MRPSLALKNGRDAIFAAAARYGASNIRVFGSTLRGDDTDTSDLDLLVDVTSETSLLDIVKLQHEIEDALGVSVDVLTAEDLPRKFRDRVLRDAKPL